MEGLKQALQLQTYKRITLGILGIDYPYEEYIQLQTDPGTIYSHKPVLIDFNGHPLSTDTLDPILKYASESNEFYDYQHLTSDAILSMGDDPEIINMKSDSSHTRSNWTSARRSLPIILPLSECEVANITQETTNILPSEPETCLPASDDAGDILGSELF